MASPKPTPPSVANSRERADHRGGGSLAALGTCSRSAQSSRRKWRRPLSGPCCRSGGHGCDRPLARAVGSWAVRHRRGGALDRVEQGRARPRRAVRSAQRARGAPSSLPAQCQSPRRAPAAVGPRPMGPRPPSATAQLQSRRYRTALRRTVAVAGVCADRDLRPERAGRQPHQDGAWPRRGRRRGAARRRRPRGCRAGARRCSCRRSSCQGRGARA